MLGAVAGVGGGEGVGAFVESGDGACDFQSGAGPNDELREVGEELELGVVARDLGVEEDGGVVSWAVDLQRDGIFRAFIEGELVAAAVVWAVKPIPVKWCEECAACFIVIRWSGDWEGAVGWEDFGNYGNWTH